MSRSAGVPAAVKIGLVHRGQRRGGRLPYQCAPGVRLPSSTVLPCYHDIMSPIVKRRARVRGDRHQVTLPAEIRAALQVRSGDEIEFSVDEHGTITVRGFTSIPTDQAWFFTPSWQAGERQADEQIAGGEGDFYASDEDFLASFPAG